MDILYNRTIVYLLITVFFSVMTNILRLGIKHLISQWAVSSQKWRVRQGNSHARPESVIPELVLI